MIGQPTDPEIDVLVEKLAARLTGKLGVQQEYFSSKEACKFLGVSNDYLYQQVNSGKLPASNIGTVDKATYRFAKEDLVEHMRSLRAEPKTSSILRRAPQAEIPENPHSRKNRRAR